MKPRLRSPELDNQLRSNGFVVTPLLTSQEAAELAEEYRSLAPQDDDGLVIDFTREDRTVLQRVAELLEPVWARHLDELFWDHRVVVATFVTKYPGADSAMLLHEEPTFVDERRARSSALWIPLVDTGPDLPNGHLQVLPGSDRLPSGMAGFRTPVQFRPYEAALREHLVPLEVHAGEAAIYDSRTLHASAANLSKAPRPAIAAAVVPRTERLIHVVPTGRRHRQIHQVDSGFFIAHHPGPTATSFPPAYPVIEEYEDNSAVTRSDVAELLGTPMHEDPTPVLPDDLNSPTPLEHMDVVWLSEVPGQTDLELAVPDTVGQLPGTTVVLGDRTTHTELRPFDKSSDAQVASRLAELRNLVRRARAADLLIVGEGGRAVLLPPVGVDFQLVVVECPRVNAGIRTTIAAEQLDVGATTPLSEEVTLWNEGPGPLVALVLATRKDLQHRPRRWRRWRSR